MASDGIDSGPPPAVRNLRSKFEQLAQQRPPSAFLSPEDSDSARPRAMSSTFQRPESHQQIRPSSSSSDLKGIKRPPPPPPLRASAKAASPSPSSSPFASPLLRPVPIPPLAPSSLSLAVSEGPESPLVPGGVAALRSKFAASSEPPPRPTTPRPVRAVADVTSSSAPVLPQRPSPESSLLVDFSPDEVTSSPHTTGRGVEYVSERHHTRTASDLELAFSSPLGGVALLKNRFASEPPLPPPRAITPKPPIPLRVQLSDPDNSNFNVQAFDSLNDVEHASETHHARTPSDLLHEAAVSPQHNGGTSLRTKFPVEPPQPPPRIPAPKPTVPSRESLMSSSSSSVLSQSHISRFSYPIASSPDGFISSNSTLSLQTVDPPHSDSPFEDDEDDSEPADEKHHSRTASSSSIGPYQNYVSSESDSSITKHRTPPPPPRMPPPRPPPRHQATLSPVSTSSTSIPPPLPVRRGAATPVEEPPPRLPVRPTVNSIASAPPAIDRKTVGMGKLPPPPTRTIALGDKLPPPRRPPSPSSDEESGDEDDKTQSVDALPDSSRSSRRPPAISAFNYSGLKIHVPPYSGHVAIAGPVVVVAHNHHVRGYDLTVSDAPVWNLESKEFGKRDTKVTAMEFRAARLEAERGVFLWMGTKDGHLHEVDVRTGQVVGSKLSAHPHAVTHIFRHGRAMLTVDESGKLLVFEPAQGDPEDVRLTYTQPRVFRIAEKQEFVRFLAGRLWCSTRADMHGAGAARTPVLRVYDPFVPGSLGRSLLPTEHVGAVTSGTILPSHPRRVYIGHEAGFISIWAVDRADGVPVCEEVMRVSSSDVLSLDGVNDRLWAGGRQGMIAAYDVVPRPWVVTNCWMAHDGLPVLKLMADPYSIDRAGRLCVVSIGRDEQLRFWDGLLGADWIEKELLKREHVFSMFRNINVLIVSWNVDAAKPDALNGDPVNINFLQDVLSSVDAPDIISFGFQEVIDLESRKMAAKSVLLGGKKKSDDGKISEKVTSAYKRWHDRLLLAVRLAMPPDTPYTVVHTENLVGLFSCMFVKNTERISLKDVAVATIKRGMGGRYGNKGGIVARFVIDDSSICLINCHLAAGQHHVRQRNADVAAFLETRSIFPSTDAIEEPLAYVGGGDGSMVLDHEIVFVNGDMNYRIDQRRDAAVAAIKANDWASLLSHDQLTKEMKFNRGFRFRGFDEGPLNFIPTYKYDRRSNEFDSSEKRRVPAWCDRVLWRSQDPARVAQLHYKRWEANVSDHRPVSAGFTMTVKSVRQEVRAQVKAEVQIQWVEQQRELLERARDFYVKQALI